MNLIHYSKESKKAISVFVPHLGCPNTCVFCNQRSISSTLLLPDEEFIEKAVQTALCGGRSPCEMELAFFGGSFTSVDRATMERFLGIARKMIDGYGLGGLRISARPDDIDEEKLALLRASGITTIELGAQSMDNRVLSLSNRGHTAEDTVCSAQKIKAAGISLVLQMMTGLPGDFEENALNSAERLAALKPDGVRIYPLLVLKNTQTAKDYQNGDYVPQTLRDAVSLCAKLAGMFYRIKIPVVKLGLHSSAGFTDGDLIAGPYHAAFRELVDGKIIRDAAIAAVPANARKLTVHCAPADVSKTIGHRRETALFFEETLKIMYAVKADTSILPGDFVFLFD